MRKKAPMTIEEIKRELRLEEKSLRNLRRYAAKTAEEKLMIEPGRRRLLNLRWQVRVKELELAEKELRRAKRALREVEKAPKRIVDVEKRAVLIRGKWRPGLVTEEVDLLIVEALGMTPGKGVSWGEMQERCPGLKGMLTKASYRIGRINAAVRKVLHHDFVRHQKGKKPWIDEADL